MMRFTEDACRRLTIRKIELSTSDLQPTAIALYRRGEYQLLREVVAMDASKVGVTGRAANATNPV
jgi:hypothetical protein